MIPNYNIMKDEEDIMKKFLCFALMVCLLCSTLPVSVFAKSSDFNIKNGELIEYKGPGGAVTIPKSVKKIGYYAFGGRDDIKSVIIPNSVTIIDDYAFRACCNLNTIKIPDSVTSIGESAFDNFTTMGKGLTSVTIPSSVKTIGKRAFFCTSLTSVTIPSATIGIGAFEECRDLTSVTLKNSVKTIATGAFMSCSSLKKINIPNSVKTIGQGAFQCCSSLESIKISNSVTEIGYGAFDSCIALKKITIPKSVKTIKEDSAFTNCTNLTSINVDGANKYFASEEGVLFTKDKTTLLCYPNGAKASEYTVPKTVKTIGREAFTNCTDLKSISIPDSVKTIGMDAFQGCAGLTNLTIPNSVTKTQWNAFNGCKAVTSLTIPKSLKTIGEYSFANWTGLTSVIIPNTVSKIGAYAFQWCFGLTSATIESKMIGEDMFRDCTALTSVTITNSVKSIGSNAFANCTALTNITIPESVTEIGETAFVYDTRLTSITIPKSVKTIGWNAFFGCENLTIYGSKGSIAEKYAKENKIPFKVGDVPIQVNGITDWNRVASIASATDQSATSLKVIDDADYIYIYIQGSGLESEGSIYIDSDNNSKTGYIESKWTTTGLDYLISNGHLFSRSANDNSWNWTDLGTTNVVVSESKTAYEARVAKSALSGLSGSIRVGFWDMNSSWELICRLPASGVLPEYKLK